jgi:hypothetical protein
MRKTLFIALLVCGASLSAQLPGDLKKVPALDATSQGKKDAMEAFKNGDHVAGLGKLKTNVDKSARSPKEEIQVNAQLVEISHWLANEQHPRTQEVAVLALEETHKSRAKLSRDEDGAALVAMGQLYERILGDLSKAKASYTAALVLIPHEPEATRGLARLNALAVLVETKARENEALRQRALNPNR